MPASAPHDALRSVQATQGSAGNTFLTCYLPCLSPSKALAELAEDCTSMSPPAAFLQASQTVVWHCKHLPEITDMAPALLG